MYLNTVDKTLGVGCAKYPRGVYFKPVKNYHLIVPWIFTFPLFSPFNIDFHKKKKNKQKHFNTYCENFLHLHDDSTQCTCLHCIYVVYLEFVIFFYSKIQIYYLIIHSFLMNFLYEFLSASFVFFHQWLFGLLNKFLDV